tara:strand:- start:1342 stop:1737 length:396 start_codon:yes stop_codon:yes gene_type:complete
MQLTKNFHLLEFCCNDGVGVPSIYLDNVKKLANNLQVLRDELNSPITINSSYRHEYYNKKIGGAKYSQHLTASASDITVRDIRPKKLARTILKLIKSGKMDEGGVGLYNGFVHYDIRGKKARWDNSSLFNF